MPKRREFLKIAGSALAWSAVPGCVAGAATVRTRLTGNTFVIPAKDAAVLERPGATLIVHAEELPVPVVVRHLPGLGLIAVSTVCSHAGCEVRVLPRGFECPCHGSQYDAGGSVVEGPAPRPLERFAIEQTADHLLIRMHP